MNIHVISKINTYLPFNTLLIFQSGSKNGQPNINNANNHILSNYVFAINTHIYDNIPDTIPNIQCHFSKSVLIKEIIPVPIRHTSVNHPKPPKVLTNG